MRIFATADLHGDLTQIELLKKAAEEVDLILICGNIAGRKQYDYAPEILPNETALETIYRNIPPLQAEDVKRLDSILDELPVPSYYILGNKDWCESDSSHRLTEPAKVGEYTLFPLEYGIVTREEANREANENKIMCELSKYSSAIDDKSIIVSLTQPYRDADNRGSYSAYEWTKARQPHLWICSRGRGDFGYFKIGETVVFNCSTSPTSLRGWLIDPALHDSRVFAVQKNYHP